MLRISPRPVRSRVSVSPSRGRTALPTNTSHRSRQAGFTVASSATRPSARGRARKASAKAAEEADAAEADEAEAAGANGNGTNHRFKSEVESLEKRLIAEALERNNGNRSKAAEELGIYRRLLYAKMREYGLGE